MAVYAAHITRTLQGTPSVFQVTAQDALGATVKPALKKLVEYLAATYPNRCGWCLDWYDELYLLFDCCLQYHYLKHYAASFSESFYGLLRVPISSSSEFLAQHRRLPRLAERASLALLVLAPYLRGKLERAVDRWREDQEDGRLGKGTPDSLRRAAIRLYALIHFTTECAKLVQTARYLTGASRAHSPSLAVLGLTLREAPEHRQDTEEYTWTDLAKSVLTGQIGQAVVTFPMVGGLVLRAAEYGAFGVQLLRWWDGAAHRARPDLPTPAPPKKEERDLKLQNKCPICLRTWKIPTVLPVSGYVFCYVCISRHVRGAARCPVTRWPARERDLVRLYVD